MPSGLSSDQIVDLVTLTQKDLGRMRWTDLGTDIQHFEVLPRMLRRDRISFETGEGLQKQVMVRYGDNARHVGLYATDQRNVVDLMKQISVPFRHTTASYSFDRREKAFQMGSGDMAPKIVDLVKTRRAGMLGNVAELCEDTFWSKPVDSTDNVTPFGIKYWVVTNATTGFNGGNPSGFTAGAGNLSSTAQPRWKNYTGTYSAITKADLIKKWRTAVRKTRFMSPMDVPDYRKGRGQNFRHYVNEATLSSLEDVGEAQNENLGRDLASMDGTITFRRNPIVYVPKLDADTTNPIYSINWNVFGIFFLRGEYMREEKPEKSPNQHTVFNIDFDMSWNTECVDRRANSVFYAA